MVDKFTYSAGTVLRKKQVDPFATPRYLIVAEHRMSDYDIPWYRCFELSEIPAGFKIMQTVNNTELLNMYGDPISAQVSTFMEDELKEETIKIR